jgi:hypothetical protein
VRIQFGAHSFYHPWYDVPKIEFQVIQWMKTRVTVLVLILITICQGFQQQDALVFASSRDVTYVHQSYFQQSASHSRQKSDATVPAIAEPPIPKLTPLPLNKTTLTEDTVYSDVNHLKQIMSGHAGDSITRGPDQLVYNMDVTINPALHEFAGHTTLHLHNNLHIPLSTLYLNVWANSPHFRRAGGYEQVTNVTVDNRPVTSSESGTVLKVVLKSPISPGQSVRLSFDFLSVLPRIDDMYGWQGTGINLGNWCPVLAVYDQYGWITPPFYADGESFYTLTGVFHVHVTVPKGFVLAATGELTSVHNAPQNQVTYNFDAVGVRDFAMVGDTRYKTLSMRQGDTTITVYFTPELSSQAMVMANAARKALEYFDAHYGQYPYKTLRVCTMRGWFGGMEYPELEMISFQSGATDDTETTVNVVHETAHQWFYSMVGDDQYLTPWMDEAFAEFSERRVDGTLSELETIPVITEHVSYPVSSFVSSDFALQDNHYYDAVYYKGAQTLYHLMKLIGTGTFDAMMKAYFQRYQYQVTTTEDFMKFASSYTGRDLTSFFHSQGVYEGDALNAPTNQWAVLEMAENKQSWHTN